jgi:hypothetical protein
MKKALLSIIAVFIIGISFAQISYGPKVGFTLSKYAYKYISSDKQDIPEVNFKLGPAIGGMMELEILDFLAFQPSLMIAKKGTGIDISSEDSGEAINTGYDRIKVTYLELPLNIAFKLKLGTFRFQVFAGPYFAYAIAGKHKWDYEQNKDGIRKDIKGDEKINFKNEVPEDNDRTYYQRPMDIGINFGLGFQVSQVLLNLGFAMGLSNLQPDVKGDENYAADHKYYNRTIFVSAAWLFGGE